MWPFVCGVFVSCKAKESGPCSGRDGNPKVFKSGEVINCDLKDISGMSLRMN
jgi:hypothetical protein